MAQTNDNDLFNELYNAMLGQQAEQEVTRLMLCEIYSIIKEQDLSTVKKNYYVAFEFAYRRRLKSSKYHLEMTDQNVLDILQDWQDKFQ